MRALSTSVKRPNVMIVIGSVKKNKMGFTIKFNALRTTETMSAVRKLLTETPGNRQAEIMIAKAETNQFKNNLME